mmetsp:Transcript_4120/g.2673  ORF Transcript_4120/g.2673 Transcript_4120/m.2673 type:complete len:148 (+) Transcript_4120:87-530(+)
MLKRHFDTIFGAMSVVVVVVVAVIVAVSCVKPKTQPTLPPNHPKRPTSPQATIYTQQSAPVCLYRHQRDTIIASPPPPWRRCAVVGRCCHCPGPKTRTWHKRRRGSVARAKPQQATLSPRVNDASGASYRWRRWWGRCGRSDGVTKG